MSHNTDVQMTIEASLSYHCAFSLHCMIENTWFSTERCLNVATYFEATIPLPLLDELNYSTTCLQNVSQSLMSTGGTDKFDQLKGDTILISHL